MPCSPSNILMRTVTLIATLGTGAMLPAQETAVLIAQGDSLLTEGKTNKALELYDAAVKAESSAATHVARSRAFYVMGRLDRSLQDVEQALKLDSTWAEAHYQLALHAMRREDHAATVEHATQAIALATDSLTRARAHLLRGESEAEGKRHAAAIADLERGLNTVKEAPVSMAMLAKSYDAMGRHADALAVLERLCELEPDGIGHWVNRGFELIQLERYDEAFEVVQRALRMDKDEPVALSHRAYINLKLGRDKEAWTDVERSLRAFPSNPYALRTRALIHLNKGERDKACKDLTLSKVLGDIPEVDNLVQEHCGNAVKRKRK